MSTPSRSTKIYRLATGAHLECLGDPIGEVLIQNQSLREHQRVAAEQAGCALVDAASAAELPTGAPFVSFPDDLYLSQDLLRVFVDTALRTPARPAVLALPRSAQLDAIASTQDVTLTEAHVLYPVHYQVPGAQATPVPVVIDAREGGFELRKRMPEHVLAAGEVKMVVTTKSILQIITPIHLHLANMLAIMNRLAGWKPKGLLALVIWLGRLLARKPDPTAPPPAEPKAPPAAFYKVLQSMNRIGKNCDIHPTAVIEGSVIGDNVRIGANAYVQFSHIGDNADIGATCCVLTSVIGHHTVLVTREWVSLTVVYPNVFFAPRFIQFALVGRDAQVFPSMYYDYRLDGKPILTWFRGKLVDAKTDFLGPIIGHRAKVSGGLSLGPGRMVPNGVTLYPNEATVINRLPQALPDGTVVSAGQPIGA